MKVITISTLLFILIISCNRRNYLINKYRNESLEKGNVQIWVENNIDTSDVLKVFEDDSLLINCSGYEGLGYAPLACNLSYHSVKLHTVFKVVLNDSIVQYLSKTIEQKKLNRIIVRKDGENRISIKEEKFR